MAYIYANHCPVCKQTTEHRNSVCVVCSRRTEEEENKRWNALTLEQRIEELRAKIDLIEHYNNPYR
jgi:hypothetical protein